MLSTVGVWSVGNNSPVREKEDAVVSAPESAGRNTGGKNMKSRNDLQEGRTK